MDSIGHKTCGSGDNADGYLEHEKRDVPENAKNGDSIPCIMDGVPSESRVCMHHAGKCKATGCLVLDSP